MLGGLIRHTSVNWEGLAVLLGLWLKLYLGIHFVLTIGAETLARRYISLAYHQIPRRAGLALVYAHEVGHHYAGEPRYPAPNDWASCEGQADYWASLVSMRKVYPGEEYLDVIFPAAEQLYKLFSTGLRFSLSVEEQVIYFAGSCNHPPADCRRDTYIAGAELRSKPSCAG
jgi:hypothetical protein